MLFAFDVADLVSVEIVVAVAAAAELIDGVNEVAVVDLEYLRWTTDSNRANSN